MSLFGIRLPTKLLPANMLRPFRHHSPSTNSASPPTPSSPHLYPKPPSQAPITPIHPHAAQTQTRYVNMLLSLDTIPRTHNLLAAFSTWILLAGFLIIPGTFTSIQKSSKVKEVAEQNAVVGEVLDRVQHTPLVWIAGGCMAVGAVGVAGLWWRWRGNYVWVGGRLFLTLTLNSLAGLISTLINVYSQHGGHFSPTAQITLCVTASCAVSMACAWAVYTLLLLEGVKRRHGREMRKRGGGAGGNV